MLPQPRSLPLSFAILSIACLPLACTTLGPMPGMTMANSVPEVRPGGEVGAAIVPGYYLSDSTGEDPDRDQMSQLYGFFDPGYLWPLKGLSVGGRWVAGGDETGYFEPMLRYRTFLDNEDRVALSAVGFGTYVDRSHQGASYSVVRAGAELATDIRLTPISRWAELHLLGGASLTVLSGDGSYCMDEESGYGIDCTDDRTANAEAELLGAYPSAFVGVNVQVARHLDILFHGLRVGGFIAGGTMPRIRFAEQQDSPESWFTWGANASFDLGAAR
ncbi:MAG: hypothetical protein JW797_20485 [Bradymonadales bacterium]|nr:hypothetical protein [Bradymonadales bacterium]